MIYNGFDPGVLAVLAGEDRMVQGAMAKGGATEESDENAQANPGPGDGILICVAATVLLAAAILLSGIGA
ncbi:hypothetical protein M3484_01630 [Pseudomonas sp. GX19020]|uniref:hypothetical protein n=1 Tax=Pseudomonas sp. GX19020 TaxID=2942277 RepID=UPI002018F083|nr:hypothetical protein [Pseudomonas sp. GX19020]MCL4065275.1 hypothetical protein [Pseudomonas sp. GX19020]